MDAIHELEIDRYQRELGQISERMHRDARRRGALQQAVLMLRTGHTVAEVRAHLHRIGLKVRTPASGFDRYARS